jgi:hypothetical protein
MKRLGISLLCGFAIAATSVATGFASPPNLTGTWSVQQTGLNGNSTTTVTLTQSGAGVVGTSSTGNGFNGTFVNDTQINGKWKGPGGAGWLTVYASPNGHSFNGTWGYNGRAANGSFVGNKVLPPSPLSASGTWHVLGAGGPATFVGKMVCKQSGAAVVCVAGGVTLNGKQTPTDPHKVRATFNAGGAAGVFSFWFNNDNNSFNGVWWNNSHGNGTPTGRVVGQRSLGG